MKKKTSVIKTATQEDIKIVRIDLKKVEKSIRMEILKVEGRVENLEEGQKRIESKVMRLESKVDGIDERTKKMDTTLDDLRNTLDRFVGGVETLKQENTVGVKHTRELRVQVDDHESRISALEPQ